MLSLLGKSSSGRLRFTDKFVKSKDSSLTFTPCSRRSRLLCEAAKRRGSLIQSDGEQHLGSSLDVANNERVFPEPPSGKNAPPLRILPIGGLGEIGMNCMLVGVHDRYILIDAGLMFPDFTDMGMQKILPDTAFIHQWRDRIEAVVITHGHEDHIGAMPWVFPALDPNTPVYATSFVQQLLQNRLKQYRLWNPSRFHLFEMNKPFSVGPFECEAIRVTHSIPDCCGLILRSEHGTILHTGDWKIDEEPVDGKIFDREAFEKLSKEKVTLMMSDSTNVLTSGRTVSENVVRQSIISKAYEYRGKGRIVASLFASNIHRLGSLKLAADVTGRKLCFVGLSLETYLAAAYKSGDAPFDPGNLINSAELEDIDPDKVLIVTTGSQAEPRSALSLAANDMNAKLKLGPDDLVLYSAKIIPGNDKRVMKMMNQISKIGCNIVMDRSSNLHASGHGYKEELAELIKIVKPQHFLPIHGESVFLHAHAELAKELGINRTSVIHDGEMLGVKSTRSRKTVSSGSMQVLGEFEFTKFYNDGHYGTGTYEEMAIQQKSRIANEGIIIIDVDVKRPPRLQELLKQQNSDENSETGPTGRVKITYRGIWTKGGVLTNEIYKTAMATISKCQPDSSLAVIERKVATAVRRACRIFNKVVPDVIVVTHEHDPRIAATIAAMTARKKANDDPKLSNGASDTPTKEMENTKVEKGKTSESSRATTKGKRRRQPRKQKQNSDSLSSPGELVTVSSEMIKERNRRNPRENPIPGVDVDYG